MKYIMKSKNIIVAAAVSFMLTGCGLYNKYESKAPLPIFITESGILWIIR